MSRATVNLSKLEQIRSEAVKKTDLGTKVNKGVIQGKGGKYVFVEKEKKFEEAGIKRKKRNYVLYESKLGAEKEKDLQKIHEPQKPRPKPKPSARPRVEEKIVQKKKRHEYLDNYQYHGTKNIKNSKKASIVTHQRLGDIVGGVYEEHTYQRMTMNDSGRGPKLYSEQTTKTTSRGGPQGQPTQTTQRTINTSGTVQAQSRDYRKEVKRNGAPSGRGNRTTTTTTKTITIRSSSRTNNPRGNSRTTNTKTVTRGQSDRGLRGRRH